MERDTDVQGRGDEGQDYKVVTDGPMRQENIQTLKKDTIWYKKVRNGLWRVMRGNKKVTEHSMEAGAKAMCEGLIRNQNAKK